ncbi:MAG: CocE/NonD family hydrolase [Candidatus Poseidoniales archaeon]|nr:MAG: CocE/NonD family hydrolase [Candidatus Poseidoniales archaeon]
MAGAPDDDVEIVLDAIIADAAQQKIIAGGIEELNHGRRQLNFSAVTTVAVSIVFLLLAMTFGESLIKTTNDGDSSGDWWDTPLQLRHTMELPMDTLRAQLPVNGTYEALPYTEHFIEVELPASEQDVGFPGPALMHIALWLPNVPEGEKIPVIMTIHPYYDFGGEGMPGVGDDSSPNTVPDGGVGKWVYDTFLPHGYAFAQASTFGTGQSTHCQDVKGLGEQTGIQAATDWLGQQNWSNGNVGLMGKSYAGTTNWEAAQNPSEHLKTIVPISGSIGVQEMFYRNGSSEARAMGYDAAYQAATTDLTTDDVRMCSDDLVGPLNPWSTWGWAEFGGADWSDYWDERRHLPDVLENYKGSVYIVWGLQDWNVDPYHAFPTYQLLRDAGINTRAISGQWAHNYPDQPDRHSELSSGYGSEAYPNMSRMDWAVELFGWFNYYLKDIGEEPEPMVQIQTNDGRWHVEETWPPEDVSLLVHDLSSDWNGASGTVNGLGSSVTMTSPEFPNQTHISGLPTLHLEVMTQACNGGQIFATMYDDTSNLRLGHATMDIRYRDGGYEAKATAPGTGYTMLMEFNPLDVIVPAGHSLRIELTETGEDYLPGPCAGNPLGGLIIEGGTVGLPLIDRPVDDDRWFLSPAWWDQQPIPS